MHQLQQHLVDLLNQMLAAFFAIVLAIWLKLRNARKAKGLTIEETAELLGVAPGTYSRWERLRQRPHSSHRLLLLQTFGPDIEEEEDRRARYWRFEEGEMEDEAVPDEWLAPSYWN